MPLEILLQTTPTPLSDLLIGFFYSEVYYIVIAVIFAWAAFDKYLRKKYVLHLVQEEGNNLTEVKTFSKPLSWGGKFIEWKIRLSNRNNPDNKPIVREYKLDPKNVVYTDKFNKRHIIGSIDNVFAFHPYSDEKDKVKFITIAKASADELGATISKSGFLARVETTANALGVNNRGTILLIAIVGIVIGMGIVSMFPSPFGLIHTVAQTLPSTTTSQISSTTSTILGSSVTSIP